MTDALTGHLPSNIMHFARLLRRAGLTVGPSDMLAAQAAVQRVDIDSRAQVSTALCIAASKRNLFGPASRMFWRDASGGKTTRACLSSGCACR